MTALRRRLEIRKARERAVIGELIRTHMADKITPRAKRLLMIAMVTPWLFLIVYYGAPLLNSQRQHLIAVEEHITKITPQWETFRAEHPGFHDVRLFAYTGGTACLEPTGTCRPMN